MRQKIRELPTDTYPDGVCAICFDSAGSDRTALICTVCRVCVHEVSCNDALGKALPLQPLFVLGCRHAIGVVTKISWMKGILASFATAASTL